VTVTTPLLEVVCHHRIGWNLMQSTCIQNLTIST